MQYTYGIVWKTQDLAGCPVGIADTAVTLEHADGVSALVSTLDDQTLTPSMIAARSADLRWMGEQAAAHDRVITWVSDHGPVIPLPPFSLFHDAAGVHRMLTSRHQELTATLQALGDAREYTVRVFRADQDLMKSLANFSPAIASLESRISAASPGQRYLLERKLDAERQPAAAVAMQRVTDAVLASLSRVAKRVVQDEIPETPSAMSAANHAVVNASFLVAANATQAFQEAVTALVEQFGTRGFRFEFTGPWAPYHFVRTANG